MADHSDLKVNVFALPSQTNIIFGLIVAVLLGTISAGSIGPSPICIWPLALGLFLLPLRSFLARPEKNFARHNLHPAGSDLADLKRAIESQASKIGLRRSPELVISPGDKPEKPYVFGTFRHWYIAIGEAPAKRLQEDLTDSEAAQVSRAKVVHELYHFKTGDYWQMGYTRELFRLAFLFMAWAAAFLCGFGLMLLIAAPDIVQFDLGKMIEEAQTLTPGMADTFLQLMPSPAEMDDLRQKAESINMLLVINFAVSATLPYVIIGGVLWGLYWPKLWRLRELYADAGVVQTQRESKPFLSALTGIPLSYLQGHSVFTCSTPRRERTVLRLLRQFWRSMKSLPSRHPSWVTRVNCIRNPRAVFGDWRGTAILVGSLVLLLDILLASPLTLLYVGDWPMHFSILIALIVVSLSLIPQLVYGEPVWSDIFKIVSVIVGLRLAWLLITIVLLVTLLIFAPGILDEMLASGVASIARFAGYSENLHFEDLALFVIEASVMNLAQVVIIFLVLLSALFLIALLARRILTWYGLPKANRRLMKVIYLAIALVVVFFGLVILPPITIALLRPSDLLHPLGIAIGFVCALFVMAGLGFFLYVDRQYGRHCPSCGANTKRFYSLGTRCPNPKCREILHPWLIAEYEL